MPSSKKMMMAAAGAGGGGGGELWFWGEQQANGGSGLGTVTPNYSSPVQVGAETDWEKVFSLPLYENAFVAALKTDGTIYRWGYNAQGQLGVQDIVSHSSPVQLGAANDYETVHNTNVYASHYYKSNGTIWCSGYNEGGILGITGANRFSSPVQIGALTDWTAVRGGQRAVFATKSDGTIWSWGDNVTYGATGQGTTTGTITSPTQIGSLTDWTAYFVTSGDDETCFVKKTDGTIWAWGAGDGGCFGAGQTPARFSSPVQVTADTDWAVLAVTQDYAALAIIKDDGSLWTMGTVGTLGLQGVPPNPLGRSSPIQVGALTDWASVEACRNCFYATKTDGTIWAWGSASLGQLGIGLALADFAAGCSSPTQIGSLDTWLSVGASGNAGFGIKTPS